MVKQSACKVDRERAPATDCDQTTTPQRQTQLSTCCSSCDPVVMSNKTHRQTDHTDAAPSHSGMTSSVSHGTQYQARNEDLADMYKFRNGNGAVLQTPKRSSVARAKALLTTPPKAPPCLLTITGSDWPVASVVRAQAVNRRSLCVCWPALAYYSSKDPVHSVLSCCRSPKRVWKPISYSLTQTEQVPLVCANC